MGRLDKDGGGRSVWAGKETYDMKFRSIVVGACALTASIAFADTTPVMVSLVTPVQAPSRSYDVTGLRLSFIYGDCREFTGLDLGVIQRTADAFTGVALGGVNIAGGRMLGGQVGLVNWSGDTAPAWHLRSTGVQFGLVNYAGAFCGLQSSLANITGGAFAGLQDGVFNCADDMYGVQCGLYFLFGVNIAYGNVRGCQIGLVNFAETMDSGLQIGLLNIIGNNGWLPVLPIVNGHF